jgi:hypothetical protein
MGYRVTPAEVRYRFRALTSTDISDDTLNSIGYIPLAEAFVNTLMSNSSVTYADLTADQKTLVKGAELARTCQLILLDFPEAGWETGPIKYKPQPGGSGSAQELLDRLENEWKTYLGAIGVTEANILVTSSGGDAYAPDGEDDRNIDFVDEDSDTWSVWQ